MISIEVVLFERWTVSILILTLYFQLFTLNSDAMMTVYKEGITEGIKVGGKLLQGGRFADDQGMDAGSESGL